MKNISKPGLRRYCPWRSRVDYLLGQVISKTLAQNSAFD